MFKQKGAMFGLDARIALAIFGALSVISGAALYSAIQEAKVTSLLTEMNEMGKAYYAYALDTGQDLPMNSVPSKRFEGHNLVDDPNIAGWSGPYLSYEKELLGQGRFLHPTYTYAEFREAKNNDFTTNDFTHCNASGDPCYVWAQIRDVPKTIIDALDVKVDGGDGVLKGNFRSWDRGGGAYDAVLKVGLKINQ